MIGNRYIALSNDEETKDNQTGPEWLTNEFPLIPKAINKVNAVAKELENFTAGKRYDDEDKQLYDDIKMVLVVILVLLCLGCFP